MDHKISLSRRKALVGAVALAAAATSSSTAVAAADNGGFEGRLEIAFDGVGYPSWDTQNMTSGFMILVQTYAPFSRSPYMIQTALQFRNGNPIPVRQENRYNQYRSNTLGGTAMDWAVMTRPSGTISMFLPYDCIDLDRVPLNQVVEIQIVLRLLIQTANGWSSAGEQFDRRKALRVEFQRADSPMVQRIVSPAPAEPGQVYRPPHIFQTSFDSNSKWDSQ